MFFVLSVSVPSCPFVTSILITAWFATTRAHIVATWRKSKFEHCHVSFAFIIFHILALPPASHETFVHHFNTFLSVIPIMYSIMEWNTSPTLIVSNSCRKKNLECSTCYEFRLRAGETISWVCAFSSLRHSNVLCYFIFILSLGVWLERVQ